MSALPTVPQSIAAATLGGSLVRLEPLAESHFEGLLAAALHPTETFPFTFVPRTREALRRWLDQALGASELKQAVPFATLDARDGTVVGSTRFATFERWEWPEGSHEQRAPGFADAVEIGWTWLAPRAQRSGLNTEAKLLMLGHAFEVWGVHRVTLKTDARNWRSRNAIERIGGTLDGILRAASAASDGGLRDSAWFSMLATEWSAAKAHLETLLHR